MKNYHDRYTFVRINTSISPSNKLQPLYKNRVMTFLQLQSNYSSIPMCT